MGRNIRKTMSENFSKSSVKHKPQMQETQTHKAGHELKHTTNPTHQYIIFKLQNIKDKKEISKETKGKKQLIYKRAKIKITSDFSETARKSVLKYYLKC